MYKVVLKNEEVLLASSVEEVYRPNPNLDVEPQVTLLIQNDNADKKYNIEYYVSLFTEDNLSKIKIYDNKDDLIIEYNGYKYIEYLNSRILGNKNILTNFNFTRETPVHN